jgi:hypothetical protein
VGLIFSYALSIDFSFERMTPLLQSREHH